MILFMAVHKTIAVLKGVWKVSKTLFVLAIIDLVVLTAIEFAHIFYLCGIELIKGMQKQPTG